jgi:hypothetical protein
MKGNTGINYHERETGRGTLEAMAAIRIPEIRVETSIPVSPRSRRNGSAAHNAAQVANLTATN